MLEVLQTFSKENFIDSKHGSFWQGSTLTLHIASDLIIILSYLSIALVLVYFLQRRPDIPFHKIFWLFCAFIWACGIAHLLELWTLWHPGYKLSSLFKLIIAGVAFYMARELMRLIPKALALPGLLELKQANQALAREIQKHQQTANELREFSQRMALLVQQTPLAVIEWTTDLKVVEWNPAAERIFGYSRSEALGRHAIELMVPNTAREKVNPVWNQLLHPKGRTRSTNENFTKAGKKIYCEWYNTPLVNSQGKIIGIASLVQDVTPAKLARKALEQTKKQLEIRVEEQTGELKQALRELKKVIVELQHEIAQRQQVEASLREREEQYRSVVDNVEEVIFQTDAKGYWTFLNPAWSKITGFAIADSIGTFFLDYIHPDDRQHNLEQFLPLIEGKKEYCRHEVRYLTKNGNSGWIEVFAQLTFDADGTITGSCGTLYDITERYLSAATNRALLEAIPDALLRTSQDGTYLDFIPAKNFQTPIAAKKLIGKKITEVLPPELADKVSGDLEAALATGKVQVSEVPLQLGDKLHDYECRTVFYREDEVLTIVRDVTERKQAEAALRHSEERFRSLVTHIPGVVYRCACDAHRTTEFISDFIEQISGYPATDFLHNQVRTLASLIAPQDRARVEQVVSEGVAQRQPYVLEYQIIGADGSVKWVYEKGQGVFAVDGSLLWLDGVIFDTTEYKHTQEELRSQEEQFRQLTENIHEVFFLVTPDLSKMLYISPAYEEVWGRTTTSLYEQPKSWLDSIHSEDRDRIIAALTQHLQNQQDFDQEYRIVRPDGLMRWVWVRAFHVLSGAGNETERIAGIAEDVTKRKLAEVEILNALSKEKELGDLKSRFISITSHEFRTPLTTIVSTAELLEYYNWTKEEQVEQLHLIQNAVQHLLQLLDDLLFIGTADAGQVRFNPEPLDLNEFCRGVVAEIQQGMSLKPNPKGIQHTLTFASRGMKFFACMDKKLLRQLLSNLLFNAIKYSPAGGLIQFELTCQDDKAIFQIQDQGIGIPREDLPRLFEFFYRAKNVGAIAGTGLGLAIVKTCVDLHRGEITVHSEVGVGTQFTVSLPLKNHFPLPMLNGLPPHT